MLGSPDSEGLNRHSLASSLPLIRFDCRFRAVPGLKNSVKSGAAEGDMPRLWIYSVEQVIVRRKILEETRISVVTGEKWVGSNIVTPSMDEKNIHGERYLVLVACERYCLYNLSKNIYMKHIDILTIKYSYLKLFNNTFLLYNLDLVYVNIYV